MIGRRPHARRQRRWLAATACLLWLLGVEVLPNLHLAFHADDHTHEADGTIVVVTTHEAEHAAAHAAERDHDHLHGLAVDLDVDDGAARARRDRTDGPATIELAPSAHAAAGALHHALALHRPPPPLVEPLAVVRAEWQIEHRPAGRIHDVLRARPNARGPPASA
jgi:hypothetical protein